ncbi:MAG: polymer-forming cytoskeletal protein [Candidatus Paceibacterales bacterium]
MDKMSDSDLSGPAETVVGPSVKIQGDLNSEGNIKIEGQVSGKVKTSQSLFVVPGAKIMADILAGNAIIGGDIQGNLKITGHLVLQSTAKILGDITCQVFRVEDGAQFSGKCVMQGANGPIVNGNGKKKNEAELEPEE